MQSQCNIGLKEVAAPKKSLGLLWLPTDCAVLHVIIEGEAKKKMNIDIKKSDITKKMIYLYIFHVFHDRLFHKSVLVSAYFPVLLKKKRKCMYIYCSILPMLLLAIARTSSCDR